MLDFINFYFYFFKFRLLSNSTFSIFAKKTMYRISLVSYSNTLPFKHALANSEFISKNAILNERNPADCAKDLVNNEADIALLPIGALPLLKNYTIISDFCLAAYKKVESVLLLSQVPKEEINQIYLDYQSRTSVKLVKILAKNSWKKTYVFSEAKPGFENLIGGQTAAVIIGDSALSLKSKYSYVYDLAEEWYNYTSLPAVFAVWVTNKNIDLAFLEEFNLILKSGVENRIEIAKKNIEDYPYFDLVNYLSSCIDYNFNDEKRNSITRFFELERNL